MPDLVLDAGADGPFKAVSFSAPDEMFCTVRDLAGVGGGSMSINMSDVRLNGEAARLLFGVNSPPASASREGPVRARARTRFARSNDRPLVTVFKAAGSAVAGYAIRARGDGWSTYLPHAQVAVVFEGSPPRPRPRLHHNRPLEMPVAAGYRHRRSARRRRAR